MVRSILLVVLYCVLSALPSWCLSSGPKASNRRRNVSRRTTRMRPAELKVVFDAKALTEIQRSREEEASVLDLGGTENVIDHAHIQFYSLDELFGNGFSQEFCSNGDFREAMRNAIRHDIFHSTPAYANLSPKAASFLLHPDSSLQGSWRCDQPRMTKLTEVLSGHRTTGDEFMNRLGALCGPSPSTHWMDIIGVKDRVLNHSWHQDTGRNKKTVMLGFPCVNDYDGTGVFSHGVKLLRPRPAPPQHPPNEPVLWDGDTISDSYIIRPRFSMGKEIMVYSDTDILHSAPDVTYRSSVMRFM